jgi:uncharacterized membrane protein YqjE
MTDLYRDQTGPGPRADASTAELVRNAAEQISSLVRAELRLASAEMAEKGKRAGLGAGLFGGAGIVAFYGVGALIAAVILGLAHVMPAWLAALLVAVVLFAVAGIVALAGRSKVKQAGPLLPERAIRETQTDVHTVVAAAKQRNDT